jgi:hypothetical protein
MLPGLVIVLPLALTGSGREGSVPSEGGYMGLAEN